MASNEAGGLFTELRQSLYTGAQLRGRPDDFGPADALRLATVGGARTPGPYDIGALEPGYRADIAVWPGDDIADIPDPLLLWSSAPTVGSGTCWSMVRRWSPTAS